MNGITEICDSLVRVRTVLSDDLLKPEYRSRPDRRRTTGHCYAASEALCHLLRSQGFEVEVWRQRVSEDTHWYLGVQRPYGILWVDPTKDQFDHEVEYDEGTRTGFLTKQPSKRAREILRRLEGVD